MIGKSILAEYQGRVGRRLLDRHTRRARGVSGGSGLVRTKAGLAALLTVLVITTLGSAVPAVAQENTAVVAPVALVGDAHVDLRDAYFHVYVWPRQDIEEVLQEGDEVPLLQLPTSVVEVSGSTFAVPLDPTALPPDYINDDGRVHIDVTVTSPSQVLTGYTSATVRLLRQNGAVYWIDPLQPVDDVEQLAELDMADVTHPINVDIEMSTAPDSIKSALSKPDPELALNVEPGAVNGCGAIITRVEQRRRVWAAIGATFPVPTDDPNKARLIYTGGTSRSTTFGSAVQKGVEWEASGSKSVSSSWSAIWAFSHVY